MKGDDLRYSRLGDIIHIIFLMWARRSGVTLEEIGKELNATRRTAERVRDAILRNFPQIGELPSPDKHKRFGFLYYNQRMLINGLVGFRDEELIELEKMKKQAERDIDKDRIVIIKGLINKIMVLKQDLQENKNVEDENFRILMESEGYAISQFSKQIINLAILFHIREAIKTNSRLIFDYTKRWGEFSRRDLEPYGILYNHKNYLVAKDDGIMKLFDLSRMDNLQLGDHFKPNEDFNLKKFSEQSFGVYQEEPMEVVLLFNEYAAFDAKNYHFHPTQKLEFRETGELEVRFKAGGLKSIIWELFKWGTSVQILSPDSLREAYIQELEEIFKKQEAK
ncbi:MAG: helix-turn-helix transcriptional regulator [Brevinema sp.]